MGQNEKMISNKDYYKVGENIKELRRIHEETQGDLADAIGVTKAAISNYEKWYRVPSKDDLFAIAKHYNITVSALMNQDFSKIIPHTNLLVNNTELREYMCSVLLPFICSDESMENPYFQKAEKLHGELIPCLFSDKDMLMVSRVTECIELYEKAQEEGIDDAAVGLLWWAMFFAIGTSIMSQKMIDFESTSSPDATLFDYFHEVFLPTIDDEEDKKIEDENKETLQSCRKDILEQIYYLKNSNHNQLYALADYYVAICYLFNIFGNELTRAENRIIGQEMLRLCCTLKNEYAIDFCTSLDFLNEDEEDDEGEEIEDINDKTD